MFRRLSVLYNYLFTPKEKFSLEERLFLSSVVIGILIAFTGSLSGIIFSFLPYLIMVGFSIVFLLLIIYYFGRFKKIIKPFILPVLAIYFLGVVALWIFGGGMNGQNILIAFVALILAVIIVPQNRKAYVLVVFILLIVIFYLIQYFRPDMISDYPSETERWIDSFATTLYSSFFIYMLLKYILNNYNYERMRAEEGERKLILLNADKDRFISILSHDLKAPFSTLFGFTNLLLKNIHTYDKETIAKQLKIINESAKSSYNLLEDLLMWTRAQHGKIPFEPVSIDLKNIIKDIVEAFNPDLRLKEININVVLQNELTVFADSNMLKTILRNLLSNAIKFTRRGGMIAVNANETELGITITVSDNGVGIRPQDMDKLFDVSRVHTTKGTEEESGTGLGLFITREFVNKHGGKIWVESEPGKGSTIYFSLPADPLKEASKNEKT